MSCAVAAAVVVADVDGVEAKRVEQTDDHSGLGGQ
jgi:hypothetical protein